MKRIFFILALAIGLCQQPSAKAASVAPVFTNDTVANSISFNDTFGHQVVMGVYNPATGLWTAQGVAGGFTNLTVSGNGTIGGTFGVTGLATFNSVTINGTLSGPGVSNYFASPPPIGSTAANTGAFTNVSASGTVSGTGFTSLIAAPPVGIGSVTPNGGAFTSLSASGTVSGAGFANYLLSPPAIGNAAPNTGAFTSLSASGTVSGAGFSGYLASPPAIGGTAPAAIFGSTLQVGIPGGANLNGSGTTDNAAILQAALTAAAASGGYIKLPCGKFKVSSAGLSLTLASGKHLTFEGSGSGCTTLFFSTASANSGLTVNLADLQSSVTVRGLSFTTDQATGSNTALTLSEAASNSPPSQLHNLIDDVVIRGDDYAGGPVTDYFGTGMNFVNAGYDYVTNTSIWGTAATNVGTGAAFTGHPAATSAYAVVFNFVNFDANQLKYGIYYNSYSQGLDVTSGNFTGGQYGIYVPATATGNLDELNVVGTQFASYVSGIDILTNVQDVTLTGNFFNTPTGSSIHGIDLWSNARATVTGNSFYGGAQPGSAGLVINSACTACVVTGNTFTNEAIGISAASGATGLATGNMFNSNTVNFSGTFTSTFAVFNNNTDAGFVNTSPAGVTNGAAAAAGHIGEIKSASFGTPLGVASTVVTNVGSLALTAGNWECTGSVTTLPAATTTTSNVYVAVNAANNSVGGFGPGQALGGSSGASFAMGIVSQPLFVNLSAGATYFLNTQVFFGVSTMQVVGEIQCKRYM
jgi:hypothetical protein